MLAIGRFYLNLFLCLNFSREIRRVSLTLLNNVVLERKYHRFVFNRYLHRLIIILAEFYNTSSNTLGNRIKSCQVEANSLRITCFSFLKASPQNIGNHLRYLGKSLKDCYEYDLEWTLLPKKLRKTSSFSNLSFV